MLFQRMLIVIKTGSFVPVEYKCTTHAVMQ